jgi:dTDP-4-amino-4,6-dideoxygalactose transaminase
MERIMALAEKYNLWVVEDAAQAIDAHFFAAKSTSTTGLTLAHRFCHQSLSQPFCWHNSKRSITYRAYA